jgi:hypothetical protein
LPIIWRGVTLYLPFLSVPPPWLFDDFQDEYPAWELMRSEERRDGYFEHLNGVLAGHIRDNSARLVASPGWRAFGDFKLEVDARFTSSWTIKEKLKSYNGLGLAFGGDDEWDEYYALMLGDGGTQHIWALTRHENGRTKYLVNNGYRGAPNYVKDWNGTNHLAVKRIGNTIRVYCNGRRLPNGYAEDDTYGPGRLIGLTITSYEFDDGEMEFDNFLFTPLQLSTQDLSEIEE